MIFWDDEIKDISRGSVDINDPFLRAIAVLPTDCLHPRNVNYELLRELAHTPTMPSEDVKGEANEDDEDETPSAVPVPPPAKRPKVRIEEPEEELASLLQCDETETVPLLYVPCVNGVLKAGAIAVHYGQECTVEKLEFDGRRKKAFAILKSTTDEDETMRLPAVKVHLKNASYLKNEVFSFTAIDQHPVNQAFAVFSAVKRAVGLSMGIRTHTETIGEDTPLIRRFTGFKDSALTSKFGVTNAADSRGCPRSWDSVLGQRWDVLPGPSDIAESMDTAVKSLKFQAYRDFGICLIKCTVNTTEGRYNYERDYRLLILHNMNEADSKNYITI